MGLLSKSKLKFKTCLNLQCGRGWTTPCLGSSFIRLGPTVQGQGQEGAGKTVGEIVKSARFLWSPGGSGEINFIMKVKICMNNNRFWSAWKCKNAIVCMSLCTVGLPVRKMGTVFLQFVDIGWQRKQMEGEKKQHRMKIEKNYEGFRIPKMWQILKHFAGSFHQA